jgi:hypothetical protein
MINTWEIALDGYKSPIVRKIAGDIEEKADKPIGESKRYTKKKLEFWSKGGGNRLNCRQIVVNAFVGEKLSAKEICQKYGFTYNYVRAVLVDNGLVKAGTKNGKKAVVIIDSNGRVKEYESAILAMEDFGLVPSAFRKHLYKKGNVAARNGKVAMFKKDYLELGRGNK